MVPGPTFRIKKGTETVVRFVNEYYRESSIHLHGSYSRAPFDGWAADTIHPGQYKDYYYPNKQNSRTLWYHDHAQGITSLNAYAGQAGFYIIEDDALEDKLDLPRGNYDIPIMFQSHFYTANGNISDETAQRISTYGDTFSANGQILPHFEVEPRKYRFRFVNAAASRTFNFTLEGESSYGETEKIPMWVVGSDAGFLSHPVKTESLVQVMSERWEVVIDFAQYKGQKLTLKSADTFADTKFLGTGDVLQFRVGHQVTSQKGNGPLPAKLVDLDLPVNHDVVDQHFEFGFGPKGPPPAGEWTINNRSFADAKNRIIRNVPRGTTEKWTLHGGGGWSHPVHIHLVDFQVIAREGTTPRPGTNTTRGRNYVTPYEAAALKDVVAVGTNEQLTILAKYAPWDGVYMFHCHNLIHEDHDMMAAFNVTSLPDFGYPETTKLVDPMDPRFRPQEYRGTTIRTLRDEVLPNFAKLRAYGDVNKAEEALDEYHATRVGPPLTGVAIPAAPEPTATAV